MSKVPEAASADRASTCPSHKCTDVLHRSRTVTQYNYESSEVGKAILGFLLFAFGYLILAGLDRNLEAFLVDISPMWLTQLATRF